MSVVSPHPVSDPNALAKSMIDAVTGHQPSPLDSEYSSRTKSAMSLGHFSDVPGRPDDVRF
jgi:hypothetical protein